MKHFEGPREFWRRLRRRAARGFFLLLAGSLISNSRSFAEDAKTPSTPALDKRILRTLGNPAFNLHTWPATLRWSADGRRIYSGNHNPDRITVINAETGLIAKSIAMDGSLWAMSAGEDLLVGITNGEHGRVLNAWRFPGLEPLWQIPLLHIGSPAGLALSPDGSKVALVFPKRGPAGFVQLFETAAGKALSKIPLPEDQASPFLAGLTFWKNKFVLLGFKSQRHALIALDTETGKDCTASMLAGEVGIAEDLEFSPDGERVLFVDSGGFSLWQIDGVKPPVEVMSEASQGFQAPVIFRQGDFSADGKRFAIAAYDGCRIYDAKSGELIKRLSLGAAMVKFSPTGKQLLLADGSRLHLISTETWERIDPGDDAAGVLTLLVAQEKGPLLAASDGAEVFVWNGETGRLLARLQRFEPELDIVSLTFHPDNHRLIAADGKRFWTWDLSVITSASSKPSPKELRGESFYQWEQAPEYLQAMSAQYIDHGNAGLFVRQKWAGLGGPDPDSPNHRWRYQKIPLEGFGVDDWLYFTFLSPSADWLGVGSNRTLRIYKTNPAGLQTQIKIPDGGDKFAFSDDGKWCAHNSGILGIPRGSVTVRTLPEGTPAAILPLNDEGAKTRRLSGAMAFAHHSGRLAAALNDSMAGWEGFCLWELAGFKKLATVEAHAGAAKVIAFGNDDHFLATLNADNTITLWDTKSLIPESPQ